MASEMALSYRILSESDVEALRTLRLRAFREANSSFSESYEDEASKPREHFAAAMGLTEEQFSVGCFSREQLIGMAIFKRDQRSKARHKSMIHTMFVDGEYRGQGVARKLVELLLEKARTLPGLEQVHLWVLSPDVSPARKLYLSMGFVDQGPVVRDNLFIDGKYIDAGYMVLKL